MDINNIPDFVLYFEFYYRMVIPPNKLCIIRNVKTKKLEEIIVPKLYHGNVISGKGARRLLQKETWQKGAG